MTAPITSRYPRVEGPPQRHPFQCVCGAGLKNWYVDVGYRVNKWVGSIFLCSDCVNQISVEQGYVSVDQVLDLVEQLDSLTTQNNLLSTELERANGVLNSLREFGVGTSDRVVNPVPVESRVDETVRVDNHPSVDGEPGPEKSYPKPGFSNVPLDDSDISELQRTVDSI